MAQNICKKKRKKIGHYVATRLKKDIQEFFDASGLDVNISSHKLQKKTPYKYLLNTCTPAFEVDIFEQNGKIGFYVNEASKEDHVPPPKSILDKIVSLSPFYNKNNVISYIERQMLNIYNSHESKKKHVTKFVLKDFQSRYGSDFSLDDAIEILNTKT